MSLFVGNLSNDTTKTDLEDLFFPFGKCFVNFKTTYAFVDFDSSKDAEKAIESLKGKSVHDRQLNIEWNKNNSKFDNFRHKRSRSRTFKGVCFVCGHHGHYARNCPRNRSRSRSRKGRSYYKRHKRSSSDYSSRHKRRRYSSDDNSSSYSHSRSNSSGHSSYSRSRSKSYERSSYSRSRSNSSDHHKKRHRRKSSSSYSDSRSNSSSKSKSQSINSNDKSKKEEKKSSSVITNQFMIKH